jgi:hypothetical protein
MDISARVKALARLAESRTQAAEEALGKEFQGAARVLRQDNDYERLYENLAIVDTIGFRFSGATVALLKEFADTIDQRKLTYSGENLLSEKALQKYQDATWLLSRVIEISLQLRYLETASVLRLLLQLVRHPSPQVQKRALESLEKAARYDITVYYGDKDHPGIGATPQKEILEELKRLSDPELTGVLRAVLAVLRVLLSPAMEASAWTYNTLTISQAGTPASTSVSEVRRGSIDLLKRVYLAAPETRERLSVLSVLADATRLDIRSSRSEESRAMFTRDALTVLGFFQQLIDQADLEVVQKIEHYSYWIFVHAISPEIATAARAIETRLAACNEYQIYRVLIGFEGIFGDWKSWQGRENRFEETERFRREAAHQYANAIRADNYSEWRTRIVRYAQTQSTDLATFPIFYEFLLAFARSAPSLAYELLSKDTERISQFLIPILSGLWDGPERAAVRRLIESWMVEAKAGRPSYLLASTRMFLSTERLDAELLGHLFTTAVELNDLVTVREVINVNIAKYTDTRSGLIETLLLPALHYLTLHGDASWIFNAWYRPEARSLLASLDANARQVLLENLLMLHKIDYHAEELLSVIAGRWPSEVLALFIDRLNHEVRANDPDREFEAIPFEFHKLHEPLSAIAAEAVDKVRSQFDLDRELFEFRGARLLRNIFPQSSPEFESALLKHIRNGEDTDREFVLGVLQNYQGESFVRRLCKEMIRVIDPNSPLRRRVVIALQTTGVVSGEFGMAEAYARKREEVLDWLDDPDEKVRQFAERYIADLEKMSAAERLRAEEGIALRKHRYGEN